MGKVFGPHCLTWCCNYTVWALWKLSSVPGASPGGLVYCSFLLCLNCFQHIWDMKQDLSGVQRNASDKKLRQAVLPVGSVNGVNRQFLAGWHSYSMFIFLSDTFDQKRMINQLILILLCLLDRLTWRVYLHLTQMWLQMKKLPLVQRRHPHLHPHVLRSTKLQRWVPVYLETTAPNLCDAIWKNRYKQKNSVFFFDYLPSFYILHSRYSLSETKELRLAQVDACLKLAAP